MIPTRQVPSAGTTYRARMVPPSVVAAACALLGVVSATALLPAPARQDGGLERSFARFDRNGDGKLSAEEVNRFPELKRRLEGADTNRDGMLSVAEILAHVARTGATAPAGRPAGELAPGDHTRTVTVGGAGRRYRLHIPRGYEAGRPTPVVLAFHGGGGNPESMIGLSGLNAKADEAGFVVVYPYGSGRDPDTRLTFNAGNVGGYAKEKNINDVGFAGALLDDLATAVSVDANRVFATGISNGGMMAYRLASELSDRIAAIAPVAGPMGTATCKPTRPVSVMHFHGSADELAPFNGGRGKGAAGVPAAARPEFFSVDYSIRNWVKVNGCVPEPVVVQLPDKAEDGMRATRKTWAGGKEGSEVVLIEIEGGGHTWPGMEPPTPFLGESTKDISANDLMWEFFQKHPRKSAHAQGSAEEPSQPGGRSGMQVLRTPDSRFANLPGYDFTPHYLMVDDYEGGQLRMHYIDEGPKGAPTVLMLHGNPTWSYLFREMVRPLNAAGYRTIALDYVGMGRSDKPASYDDYTYDRHLGWIRQAFEQLDRTLGLGRVTIFGHDYGVPFGIRLMAEHCPERFDAFINANASLPDGTHIAPTHLKWRQFVRDHPDVPVGNVISSRVNPPLSRAEIAAWNSPYPDASHKMAIRSFPEMVPDSPNRPEAIANAAAWRYLEGFAKPFMTIFGRFDAVSQPSARNDFIRRVPGAYGQPHPQLDVTHYAPEDKPEDVAREVLQFLAEVYHPRPFAMVQYSAFDRDFDGFTSGGAQCVYDVAKKALRLTGNAGQSSSARQKDAMDLTHSEALKVAFRYLPFGVKDGEGIRVELWDGSEWVCLSKLVAGADFRNGADDYCSLRTDIRQVRFAAQSRLRVRCDTTDASAGIYLLDLGIYARSREGAPQQPR